ncbi:hypothetical protein ZWY2020_056622 [Hordeum vulgare]|nr:hypothetical protein ZWY2020_056622 [Hordeum vulgare]
MVWETMCCMTTSVDHDSTKLENAGDSAGREQGSTGDPFPLHRWLRAQGGGARRSKKKVMGKASPVEE